jgi:DNA helicase IV
MSVMEDTSSVTFILDGAQKIYPRGFTWKEAGVTVQPNQSHRLMENYRNTKQIAALAVSILDGLIIGDDGTLPNLDKCAKEGELPIVLYGKFSAQALWCIKRIEEQIDLATETVAFLHPKGGKWFDFLRGELRKSGIPYVEITKKSEWPEGPENVVLSTMASAKGLEFDHVFIIGLNEEVTPHGAESDDSQMNVLRRLLAMAITRARKTIAIGAKREGASKLFTYLKGGSFREVKL